MRSHFSLTTLRMVAGIGLTLCSGAMRSDAQRLLVSSWGTGEVKRYNQVTKNYQGNFLYGQGMFGIHTAIYGPDGNLYLANQQTSDIKRFNGRSGAFIDTFVAPSSGGLNNPTGMTFGPDGNLYVGSAWTDDVKRYDGKTGAYLGSFASGGGLNTTVGVAFGPDGNLYVGSNAVTGGSHGVFRFNGVTGASMGLFASGNGLHGVTEFAFGPDGKLYVSSGDTHEVKRFNGATGAFIDNFVTAQSGGLNNPYGLLFGKDGSLYVSSYLSAEVKRYNGQTGAFIENVASGNGLDRPTELLWDRNQTAVTPLDLNSDGHADLLLQDKTNGCVYYWLLNQTSINLSGYVFNGSISQWKVVSSCDLNGDGKPDVLLQNTSTGAVYEWLLGGTNGVQIVTQGSLWNGGDSNWQVVGTPDLNGDGTPDVLLRHSVTGQIYYWIVSGANSFKMTAQGYLWSGNNLSKWRIAAWADLDQNGTQDLIFQNTQTGAVSYWLLGGLSGIAIISQGTLWAGGDTQWKAIAAADFNGDGKPDLIFQSQTTGAVLYWTLSNLAITSTGLFMQSTMTPWKLATVTDLNNDGNPDLIFQNSSNGTVYYWLLNKAHAIANSGFLYSKDLSRWNILPQN